MSCIIQADPVFQTRAELVAPGTVPPSAYPPRIYIRLGEGSVLPAIILRKWGCEPFEDGTEYVKSPPMALPFIGMTDAEQMFQELVPCTASPWEAFETAWEQSAYFERARIVAWMRGNNLAASDEQVADRLACFIEDGAHYD
jgi:hypothetical protein